MPTASVLSRSGRLLGGLALAGAMITASVVAATVATPSRALALPGAAESTVVTVDPTRVLDTRFNVGLAGAFQADAARKLTVTGTIETFDETKPEAQQRQNKIVVPTGATGVLLNVTGVGPTGSGYIGVRPGSATGASATSNLNVVPGQTVPNAVTVSVPTTGTNAGQIDIYYGSAAGNTIDIIVDVVGYTTNTGLVDLVNRVTALETSGVAGPPGDQGDTGPRGFSSWDVIPSGQALMGEFRFDVSQSTVTTSSDQVYVSLGAVAPVALTAGNVNFATTGTNDADTTCTGTANAPTAPAGKVCIYLAFSGGIDTSTLTGNTATLAAHGFTATWFPSSGTGVDEYVYATWAYTAP